MSASSRRSIAAALATGSVIKPHRMIRRAAPNCSLTSLPLFSQCSSHFGAGEATSF